MEDRKDSPNTSEYSRSFWSLLGGEQKSHKYPQVNWIVTLTSHLWTPTGLRERERENNLFCHVLACFACLLENSELKSLQFQVGALVTTSRWPCVEIFCDEFGTRDVPSNDPSQRLSAVCEAVAFEAPKAPGWGGALRFAVQSVNSANKVLQTMADLRQSQSIG